MDIRALANHIESQVPNLKIYIGDDAIQSPYFNFRSKISSYGTYSNQELENAINKTVHFDSDYIGIFPAAFNLYHTLFHELAHCMARTDLLNRKSLTAITSSKNVDELMYFRNKYIGTEEYIAESVASKLLDYYNYSDIKSTIFIAGYLMNYSNTNPEIDVDYEIDRCFKVIVNILGDLSQIKNAA